MAKQTWEEWQEECKKLPPGHYPQAKWAEYLTLAIGAVVVVIAFLMAVSQSGGWGYYW